MIALALAAIASALFVATAPAATSRLRPHVRADACGHPALVRVLPTARRDCAGLAGDPSQARRPGIAALSRPLASGSLATPAPGSARTLARPSIIAGGTITGVVTNAVTKVALEGGVVCAESAEVESNYACVFTNEKGEYEIEDLPEGQYKVLFSGFEGGYVSQYYNDKNTFAAGDPVTVRAGATTAGIDAGLHIGGTITGKVTDAKTKAGVGEVEVCAVAEEAEEEFLFACELTAEDGTY
ncbi:MAG TPA: carboxypeptidase-like regulatory domain-containing protein, partial [Solirubrobacteraceae bacterium]|nr:carboxypeptidase-like regulatory domain-containing protein [Solirubrobacteraceae bacterium]